MITRARRNNYAIFGTLKRARFPQNTATMALLTKTSIFNIQQLVCLTVGMMHYYTTGELPDKDETWRKHYLRQMALKHE